MYGINDPEYTCDEYLILLVKLVYVQNTTWVWTPTTRSLRDQSLGQLLEQQQQ
jgi:hypothetical protein